LHRTPALQIDTGRKTSRTSAGNALRRAPAKRDELGDNDVAHGDLLSIVEAAPYDLFHHGYERVTIESTHAGSRA